MGGGGENSRVLTVREALFPSSPTTVGHCDLPPAPCKSLFFMTVFAWQLSVCPSPPRSASVRLLLAFPSS